MGRDDWTGFGLPSHVAIMPTAICATLDGFRPANTAAVMATHRLTSFYCRWISTGGKRPICSNDVTTRDGESAHGSDIGHGNREGGEGGSEIGTNGPIVSIRRPGGRDRRRHGPTEHQPDESRCQHRGNTKE